MEAPIDPNLDDSQQVLAVSEWAPGEVDPVVSRPLQGRVGSMEAGWVSYSACEDRSLGEVGHS